MSDLTDTVQRYIIMWNETDPTRRAERVRNICTENATYTLILRGSDACR